MIPWWYEYVKAYVMLEVIDAKKTKHHRAENHWVMVKILSEDKSVNTLWDILQYLTHHSSTICQRAQASFFFYLFSSFFNITSFLFQFSHYSYYYTWGGDNMVVN